MRSAAALCGVGAALLVSASFLSGDAVRPEVLALAGLAVLAGMVLLGLERAGRGSLEVVFGADILVAAIIAAFIALTDGAHSPYSPFYLLVALHAAAFQPRRRVIAAIVVVSAAFLAPFGYDSDDAAWFAGVALPGLVPALVVVWTLHLTIGHMRYERRALAVREAEALRIAESDELTGIGNYRRFWRALQSEAARARRHEQPFSLIVLDLDGFKAINDELGHQAGDEALRRVARALGGELRVEDVLCRQGGDEFAVIAVAAGAAETGELARRLVDAVAGIGAGVGNQLAASAGWATFGDPERSAEGILARADEALRDAKRGRPSHTALRGSQVRHPDPAPDAPPAPAATPPPVRPLNGAPAMIDRRLAALSACSRDLALAQDERAAVQVAVAHVAGALAAESVELWRRDPSSGEPVLVARGNAGSSMPPSSPLSLDDLRAVMDSNRVAGLDGHGLVLPVSHGGRVEGAMVVRTGREAADDELELRRLALAMAAQLGRTLAMAPARAVVEHSGPEDLERLSAALGNGGSPGPLADLAVEGGRRMGLPEDELSSLREAALLNNIGMLGVPAGLPLRPFPLSAEEVEVLREHPIIAQRLLGSVPRLAEAARTLRHAHERHDGLGYPDGLAGDRIPPASRVLHAAIAYTAMRESRPWRPALTVDEARQELQRVSGTQLHPDAVAAVLAATHARAPAPG